MSRYFPWRFLASEANENLTLHESTRVLRDVVSPHASQCPVVATANMYSAKTFFEPNAYFKKNSSTFPMILVLGLMKG